MNVSPVSAVKEQNWGCQAHGEISLRAFVGACLATHLEKGISGVGFMLQGFRVEVA